MEDKSITYKSIVQSLTDKAPAKIDAVKKAEEAFAMMKILLRRMEAQILESIASVDSRIVVSYSERSPFDIEFKVCDDVLIFSLHSDAFTFPENHLIRKSSYSRKSEKRVFFGLISVYNFLTDSLKYNRSNDVGVLISRVFVNHENHFFVEGKKQTGFLFNDLENDILSEKRILDFLESTILLCLNSDIFTPPFEQVKIISVQDLKEKNVSSLVSTGKRLGFKLQTDTDIQ